MIEVSGLPIVCSKIFHPVYGFTAIIVAWLGRLNPLGISW